MAIITVTKTIGSAGGRNFSTPQLWQDACPVNLVTAERSLAGTFTGTFALGESLTFTGSGATGKFSDSDGSTYIVYGITAGNPAAADVITGGTSGATCVLSSGTPTDVGVIWRGECYNDSEFTVSANFARVLQVQGETTDSTHYLEITAAAGQSFQDNGSVGTNPLTYDVSKGVGFRCIGSYTNQPLDINVACRVSRLQAKHDAASYSKAAINIGNDNGAFPVIVKDCIFVAKAANGSGHCVATMINCVLIMMGDFPAFVHKGATGSSALIGCTLVRPSNLSSTRSAISSGYTSTGLTMTSCAIFGFNSLTDTAAPCVGINCATDLVSPAFTAGSSGNQTSATYNASTPFAQASSAGVLDFRAIVAATSLRNNGLLDSTNAPNDIAGAVRPHGPVTIGAWEALPSLGLDNNHQAMRGGDGMSFGERIR